MATSRICSIPDCGKPVRSKYATLCNPHYMRKWAHGDPLAGGPPKDVGAAQRFFRDTVLAYAGDDCLIWPHSRMPNGYGTLWAKGQKRVVSRLVCEAINGPPPQASYQAAHSCGNGGLGCVSPRHLSWKTPVDNSADRDLHGTSRAGERHALAKLSQEDVDQIRAMMGELSQTEIGRRFAISPSAVSMIHAGKRWGKSLKT